METPIRPPQQKVLMMKRIDFLCVLIFVLALSGCRLRRPENVLPPKKMEQFLYDYHLAQAIGQEIGRAHV